MSRRANETAPTRRTKRRAGTVTAFASNALVAITFVSIALVAITLLGSTWTFLTHSSGDRATTASAGLFLAVILLTVSYATLSRRCTSTPYW